MKLGKIFGAASGAIFGLTVSAGISIAMLSHDIHSFAEKFSPAEPPPKYWDIDFKHSVPNQDEVTEEFLDAMEADILKYGLLTLGATLLCGTYGWRNSGNGWRGKPNPPAP
jgi:hypothetical protein